jgi:sugar fermentation stimulation protein A
MRFPFTTQPAIFLERPNRFLVTARLHASGAIIQAHCPDPGRLCELLLPGALVHVSKAADTRRKTAYDLRFVEHPEHGQLISLDSRLPNAIFREGMEMEFFAPFRGARSVEREVTLPAANHGQVHSRIDYRLVDGEGRTCWIEVKSVTLVEDGCALFPDAVTARGRRHVLELAGLVKQGERAAVVFIVQRPDADRFMPQWVTDLDFAEALAQAHRAGVEIYAYTCALTLHSVTLERQIAVNLLQK